MTAKDILLKKLDLEGKRISNKVISKKLYLENHVHSLLKILNN